MILVGRWPVNEHGAGTAAAPFCPDCIKSTFCFVLSPGASLGRACVFALRSRACVCQNIGETSTCRWSFCSVPVIACPLACARMLWRCSICWLGTPCCVDAVYPASAIRTMCYRLPGISCRGIEIDGASCRVPNLMAGGRSGRHAHAVVMPSRCCVTRCVDYMSSDADMHVCVVLDRLDLPYTNL
jgi:hypothetical protein